MRATFVVVLTLALFGCPQNPPGGGAWPGAGGNDWNVNVFPGNGDGTFRSAIHGHGTCCEGRLAIADVDAGGKLDVLVADGINGGRMLLCRGLGNGVFGQPLAFRAAPGTRESSTG